MATAANRVVANRALALQTALLSVRSLRRRRLGHIGPNHYPKNQLDKWGRKKGSRLNNGANGGTGGYGGPNGNGANLLTGYGRPVPRASLVLGGARGISRRKGAMDGNKSAAINGLGAANDRINGKNGLAKQQQSMAATAASSRGYVNGSSSLMNGLASSSYNTRLNGEDADNNNSSSSNEEEEKGKSSSGKYSSDLVVVLDMDECLIHSQFLSDRMVDKYRQIEDRPTAPGGSSMNENNYNAGGRGNEEPMMWTTCDSFRINLPDGDLVNVNKRPNLDLFLREITSKFETYIFTAAMEVRGVLSLNFSGMHAFYKCVYPPF